MDFLKLTKGILTLSLLLTSDLVSAQFGIKVGIFNPERYRTYAVSNPGGVISWKVPNAKLTYHGGVYYCKRIAKKFTAQAEVMYMGSHLDHTYLFALPILVKYYPLLNFNIQLGHQINFVSENPKYFWSPAMPIRQLERELDAHVAFPVGVEYRFSTGGFISGRYIIHSDMENFEFAIGFNFRNKDRI